MSAKDEFLKLAEPESQEWFREKMKDVRDTEDWAVIQQAFLTMVEEYLQKEILKDVHENIHTHEAGGQFRIAFPHMEVRPDERIMAYMKKLMEARRQWNQEHLFHGYVDCHEVHHEIETYIYFQNPLFYYELPGKTIAKESILDVAHHIGNWVKEVPDWYDWKTHGFVSNWLGTKNVRNYPPYDYQEGNHFRFMDVAMAAFLATGETRYLDVICDYCERWCEHIHRHAKKGEPIPCSILPVEAVTEEMNKAGVFREEGDVYHIFYQMVADNTMYDIVGALLDAWKLTRKDAYLTGAEEMMDQFVKNQRHGRPAHAYSEGSWSWVEEQEDMPKNAGGYITDCTFLARLGVRYHRLTGSDKYKSIILSWAKAIDEEKNACDQMAANVLAAAHYFDGDVRWLTRAYEMALRTCAVTEANDVFHQCNWSGGRQASKFLMEMLYQPLSGTVEWGTRGNIPVRLLRHVTRGRLGLPDKVSFRIWQAGEKRYGFEAVNTGTSRAEWQIEGVYMPIRVYGGKISNGRIVLSGGERIKGHIKAL